MASSRNKRVELRPLTRANFAPFGDVIAAEGAKHFPINSGNAERYHDLAQLEATGPGARQLVSIFRAKPASLPLEIRMMEHHPLGSQAFFPLQNTPFAVVVAPDRMGNPGEPVAFLVEPDQHGLRGVNYRRSVWHHPLIALDRVSDFLVIDRGGDGNNLVEHRYPEAWVLSRE